MKSRDPKKGVSIMLGKIFTLYSPTMVAKMLTKVG